MDSDQALKFFSEGRHRAITEEWESLLAASTGDQPADPRLAQVVAASYLVLGEASRSVPICQSILPFLAEDPSFLALYGSALRASGAVPEAANVLENAHKKFPNDPVIGNNYSNLLIDLGSSDKAIELLTFFINKAPSPPNISDLKVNLERAKNSLSFKSPKPQHQPDNILAVCDPLERAFLLDEATKVSPSDEIQRLGEIIPDSLQGSTLAEHITFLRKLVSSDPKLALEELSRSLATVGPRSEFYQIAGEAYVSLKSYEAAERSFLYSLLFSTESSVSIYINLTSLSTLRSDIISARFWLQKIRSSCNDHPSISDLEKMIESKEKVSKQRSFV